MPLYRVTRIQEALVDTSAWIPDTASPDDAIDAAVDRDDWDDVHYEADAVELTTLHVVE